MNDEFITREYLESLSFSDLSNLADKYGIDVPENLNRRFLIAEILEIVEEVSSEKEDMQVSSDMSEVQEFVLPKNYNESQISCVLRNPAWLFVFWNISDFDSQQINSEFGGTLKLRICSLNDSEEAKIKDYFEVNCSVDSQEQYVLLPQGADFIKVELICVSDDDESSKIIAFSPIIEMPKVLSLEENFVSINQSDYSEIVKLSGINEVLMNQYSTHRQSFE